MARYSSKLASLGFLLGGLAFAASAGAFISEQAGARWELHPGAYGTQALIAAPAHGFEEFFGAVRGAGFLEPGNRLEGVPITP